MAGVGAASGMTMGATPAPARTCAASSTKLSPRKRGSRPTSTRCGPGRVFTYAAMPATASRILATVNSSATIARHPEVPNLIAVVIVPLRMCFLRPAARIILQHRGGIGKMRCCFRTVNERKRCAEVRTRNTVDGRVVSVQKAAYDRAYAASTHCSDHGGEPRRGRAACQHAGGGTVGRLRYAFSCGRVDLSVGGTG